VLDCLFSCSVILVFEEGVSFVHLWVLRILDQVELLESAECLAHFPDLRFRHREWNAAHEDAVVLVHAFCPSCLQEVSVVIKT